MRRPTPEGAVFGGVALLLAGLLQEVGLTTQGVQARIAWALCWAGALLLAAGLGASIIRRFVRRRRRPSAGRAAPRGETLDDALHARVTGLCGRGDELAVAGRFAEAVGQYRAAWDLLPEPRDRWDAAAWIQVAIADAHFRAGEFARALEPLKLALLAGELGNPFVHLRRGQCLLEIGDRDGAVQELARAYMGGGREIFDDEDPRYLAVLRGVLAPPAGQTEL